MSKILIVDDEKISLMMTNHILETKHETFMASSGREAVEIFKKERPDMILTDLRMPEMSGFELQSTIQELYADPIPVMFMTADATDENESRSFAGGAVDYIEKPFRADVLLSRVDRVLMQVDFKKAAETDPMTGLLNKASSQTEIGKAAREVNGTLMMIDLDSFKLVNDIYGHNMGDRILIRFSEIIRSAMRSSDLCGRMGGDEFIAYCKDVTDDDVVAEKTRYINDELLKSAYDFMGSDMTIPLGASIGAVYAPDEGTDFLTLFKKADKALYRVKQNGKHGFFVYKEEEKKHDEEDVQLSDIKNIMAVLSERNRKKGAFMLLGEQFSVVYKFLSRVESNYHKKNKICSFSLSKNENAKTDLKSGVEAFSHTAASCLRASDAVTESGNSKVLVILLETDKMYADMVCQRILKKWDESEFKDSFTITYEIETIV